MALRCRSERGVEQIRGLALHVRRNVAVAVQGDTGTGVTEPLPHDLRMDPLGEQEGRARASQVVEADHGHAGGRDQLAEPAHQRVDVKRANGRVGEDEAAVLPDIAEPEALRVLSARCLRSTPKK
jgi:hypothetical protein